MTSSLFDLSNKVAVVTGAAQGMGRAMSMALAEAGADLLLVDLNEAGVRQTAKSIVTLGRRAEFAVHDVSEPNQVRALFQRLDDQAHGGNRGLQLVGDIADKIVLQYNELLLLPPVPIQQEKGKDRDAYQYQRKEQLWTQSPRRQPESILQVYLVRDGLGKTKDHTTLFAIREKSLLCPGLRCCLHNNGSRLDDK